MVRKTLRYIKQIAVRFFWPIRLFIAYFFITTKVLDKFVLVRVDGGVCSQMHFFMIGRFFQKKGFRVKYALDWYEKNGHDINGLYVRNFDLLKAFPDIQIEIANWLERFLYDAFSFYNDYYDRTILYDWLDLSPPIFLKGYYNTPMDWYSTFRDVFKVDFDLLDEANKVILNNIRLKYRIGECEPIAVHVRRGDLSVYYPSYGEPANISYFNNAMHYIEKRKGVGFYYFFSDEPNWVASFLIPELGLKDNYMIVALNGSDKGYYDLFLISACKDHITSKGSLGKYGGFLCKESDSIITIVDDEYERHVWQGADSRIVFIK